MSYLLAICNGTNRITNDESTTTSNNKQTKDSLNVNNELEASIANLPDPKQKTPPNQLLKEEQHSIRELYAADVTTETDPRFCFSISFADESIIELDVTSEKGAVKVFDTNYTDCIADEFSTETKNQIMKWFVSGKNGAFIVVLNDRRIDSVKPQYADLEAKIDAGVELTMEEQVRYSNLGQLIKRFDHERRIKEKAITVYLKDKLFHAYSQAGFYTYLLDFIKDILNFPYRRGISQDAEYRNIFTSFDVYTKTVPKECFIVYLLKSDVEEAFKKDPLLQFAGSFVCDWGIDMAKKIAVQYYVQYIGRQIIDHERPILESNEYLNSSKASIHNWLTGPH